MPLTPDSKKKIFNAVKAALERQCPPMVCSKDEPGSYEIIGNKPVPYGSKKTIVPGMYFAGVDIRTNSVNLTFFPLYDHAGEFAKVAPELMKCLKTKTCLPFSTEEKLGVKEIDALLKKGVQLWKKLGYLK